MARAMTLLSGSRVQLYYPMSSVVINEMLGAST